MSNKFALKVIQQGQTQKIHVLTPGAGMAGQAVSIQAADGARYQLNDIVTLSSPAKLQLKRVGNKLHLALPGGDVDAPDLIINDYFSVKNASLWGNSATGEWMGYDTTALAASSETTTGVGGAEGAGKSVQVSLESPGTSLLGFVETPLGLGAVAGGLGLLALAAGGGGGGTTTETLSAKEKAENLLKGYAESTSNTKPTLANYSTFGVKSFLSLSDTSDDSRVALSTSNTNLEAINNALAKLDRSEVTLQRVQNLVDSYYRILKEADGNASSDTDVYQDEKNDPETTFNDPTRVDYGNVGATVGNNDKTLDLLNDVVGRSSSTQVDSVDEINAMARAAENVMLQAKAASSSTSGNPAMYTTDAQWAAGLRALGFTGITNRMVSDIKAALAATADDGTGVDTYDEIKEVINPIVAAHVLRSYSIEGKTAPTLQNYKDAGIKALSSLSETTASADIDGVASNVGGNDAWLRSLNSALDKLDLSSVTSIAGIKEQVQALADAYYRILKEADGNTDTDTDVYAGSETFNDPKLADYTALGVTVKDAITSTAHDPANGAGNETLNLLNDAVGRLGITAVDTVDELQTLATTANDVMLLASGGTADQTDAKLIAGLNTLMGLTSVNSANLAAVKAAISATATTGTSNDGAEVDTVAELVGVVKAAIALQTLKDFTNDSGAIGSKTATAPSLNTYTDLGIKTFKSLADTSEGSRKDLNDGATTNGAESNTFLTATILNTALDNLKGEDLPNIDAAKTKIQAMVDAYYRILREADGLSDTDTDVYADPSDATNATFSDPTLADYAAIGVMVDDAITSSTYNGSTGAGNESLDLLNDALGLLGNTSVDTAAEVQTLAATANDVMRLASGASATQTDAQLITGLNALLGIGTVTTKNLAAVKAAIADTADNGSGVQSAKDLLGVVKQAVALQALKDFTIDSGAIGSKTAATPTLNTYTDLGIKTFKSLADTSEGSRKDLNDSSTANGAESNTFLTATVLNSAIDRLDGATLDKAKVTAMVDAYYRILREADGSSTTDTDVYADTSDASNTTFSDPKLADYATIGVTVHDAIAGSAYDAVTGAGNETLDLLNDAIGRLGSTAVDTADEVQTLATTANDVMLLAKGDTATQTDTQLITGLNALMGLNTSTGVNSNNLAALKLAIAGTSDLGTGVDTNAELQALLSMARLKVFTEDAGNYFVSSASNTKTTSLPTLSDWSNAGAKANISLSDGTDVSLDQATYWTSTNPVNGLVALNSALDTYAGNSISTTSLQDIVDSYGRILQAADGSRATGTSVVNVSNNLTSATPVKQDLINVGVSQTAGTGINYLETGGLLASSIGVLASTAVDTVQELNTLAGYAESLVKHAAGTSNGYSDAQWDTAFRGLGITGVNSNNLADIKTAIADTVNDGTGIDTWDELQALVSLERLNDYAGQQSGFQTPSIIDYQSIAAAQNPSGELNPQTSAYGFIKASFLGAYNSVVDAKSTNAGSQADIAGMLSSYTKLLNLADGIDNLATTSALTAGEIDGSSQTVAANLTDSELNSIFNGATLFRVNDVGQAKAKTVADAFSDIADQLTTDKLDQLTELTALGGVLNKLFTLAAAGTASYDLTQSDLGLLGLKGQSNVLASSSSVSDNEMRVFCDLVRGTADNGAEINSFTELQNLLNNAVLTG